MQMHNYQELVQQIQTGQSFEYLTFSRKTAEEPIVNNECLSLLFRAPFRAEGALFKSAEHFVVAEKARMFKDLPSALKAIMAKTPERAHTIGQGIQGFDEAIWAENCEALLVKANFYKFKAHQLLRDFLLCTGDKVLVYADADDLLLGAGFACDSQQYLTDPTRWPGKNLLGFSLMTVRDMINQHSTVH